MAAEHSGPGRHPLARAVALPLWATVAVFLVPHLPPTLAWVRSWLLETGSALVFVFLVWAGWSALGLLPDDLRARFRSLPGVAAMLDFLQDWGFRIGLVAALAIGLAGALLGEPDTEVQELLFILILIQLYLLVVLGYRIVDIGGRGVVFATLFAVVLVVGVHVAGKTVYFLLQQAFDGSVYTPQIRGVLFVALTMSPFLLIFSYAGGISARRANRPSGS